ncbi:CPBP family glutamic-type intramembrane protease [Anaerocolumna sedimenticola]
MRKYILVILLPIEIILFYLLSHQMSFHVMRFVVKFLYPVFKHWDPENVYIVLSLNGIICAMISMFCIIVYCVVTKKNLKECGFNLINIKLSLRLVVLFLVVFMTLYVSIGTIAARNGLFDYKFHFQFNLKNYSGIFLFELFISGLEEVYFRGFLILVLLTLWKPIFKSQKYLYIALVLASTLVFTLRHIGMTLYPFEITYLVPLQLVVTTVMGLSCGYIFLRTKSLIGAYMAHSISNACIYIFLAVLNVI